MKNKKDTELVAMRSELDVAYIAPHLREVWVNLLITGDVVSGDGGYFDVQWNTSSALWDQIDRMYILLNPGNSESQPYGHLTYPNSNKEAQPPNREELGANSVVLEVDQEGRYELRIFDGPGMGEPVPVRVKARLANVWIPVDPRPGHFNAKNKEVM